MRPILCALAVSCVLAPAPALAQSRWYVSALAAGDVVRGTSTKSEIQFPVPQFDESGDGEALALLLRGGTSIGERWGVELELGFGSSISERVEFDYPFIAFSQLIVLPDGLSLPPPFFSFEAETSQRRTTVGASLWTRRPIGERAGLTFLGGIVFSRVHTEHDALITPNPLALSIVPPTLDSETTDHGFGPMAGIETDVRLTRALSLSAGVRIHGESAGDRRAWLVRPSAGLRWSF